VQEMSFILSLLQLRGTLIQWQRFLKKQLQPEGETLRGFFIKIECRARTRLLAEATSDQGASQPARESLAARDVDGPIKLGFRVWDLDCFGERDSIPYHVKLSLEGIPHHIWSREIAAKVLCDETIVHHVEEDTVRHVDQRVF
jgi:hypothetical protein